MIFRFSVEKVGTVLGALALGALSLAGCAMVSAPLGAPAAAGAPGPPLEGDLARGRELAGKLSQRDRSLTSLKTQAVMEYSGPERRVKAHEEIVVRRPASMRIEAFSPLGVAAVVAANDSQLAIFESSENTLMHGAATARTLDRFAQIPLAPKPAVNLLMGLAPNDGELEAGVKAVRVEGDLLVVSCEAPDGSTSELGFDGEQLALVRGLGQEGRYEVHYGDYRDIGGLMFAHRVEADFPLTGIHVVFRYQRPIINSAVEDSLFTLRPGPATKEIDLDKSPLLSATAAMNG